MKMGAPKKWGLSLRVTWGAGRVHVGQGDPEAHLLRPRQKIVWMVDGDVVAEWAACQCRASFDCCWSPGSWWHLRQSGAQ